MQVVRPLPLRIIIVVLCPFASILKVHIANQRWTMTAIIATVSMLLDITSQPLVQIVSD
jgi:hypothetical protein